MQNVFGSALAVFDNFPAAALVAVVCYLLGSVNMAVLVSRFGFGRDVRESGSGNAGTTNMLRTFGWKAAGGVFLFDLCKGIAGVLIGAFVFSRAGGDVMAGKYLGGIMAAVGHMFPVFFSFHGGKAAATSVGIICSLHPIAGPLLFVFGVTVAKLCGYVSAAVILVAVLYTPVAVWAGSVSELLWALTLALLVLFAHRENMKRLIEHRENKFMPPQK